MRSILARLAAVGAVAFALAPAAPAAGPPNLTRAIEAQRRLASERPADAGVANDLGNLLAMSGDLAGAEVEYRRAVELEPQSAAPRFNLGLLLQQRGELRSALAEFTAVLEIEPAHAWASYQSGVLHDAAGNDRKAVAAYARALTLDPRLGFPEVNPHVIENRLLDRAMLAAHGDRASRPQAPLYYQHPAEVSDLLLPLPPASGEESAEEAEAAAGEEAEADGPRTGAGHGGEVTVLSGSDLKAGAVNQATPAGGGSFRPPVARPGARTWSRKPGARGGGEAAGGGQIPIGVAPGGITVAPETVVAPGTPAKPGGRAPRVVVPPGSNRYRPGVLSTGRLEPQPLPGDRQG